MKKLIGFLLFLVSISSLQAKEQVKASLSQKEIKVGEQTRLDLSIQYTAGESQLIFPALRDTISKFVEIVDINTIDTTFDEEDVTQKILHQELLLTSWDSGYHVIPPFQFILNGDTLETKAMVLSVKDITIDPAADIKDIKPIIEVPFSLSDWIMANRKLLLGIAGGILLILVLIFLYRKYFLGRAKEEVIAVPKEDADRIANRKLQALQAANYWQNGEVKQYYSELSFIVREYIENRFLLPALEQTSDETIDLIKIELNIDKELVSKLSRLLLLADMAKFAKQMPLASENNEVFKIAEIFVQETKLILEEEVAEESDKIAQDD